MRNLAFLVVLALAVVITAGCTLVSEPPQIHSDIPQGTAETLAPDTRPEPISKDNSTAAMDCIERTGEPISYPVNFTHVNEDPITGKPFLKTNRSQFLELNREYIAYLVKEVGEEKANKIVYDKWNLSNSLSLLDPSSGDETLISVIIDTVGVHTAGETFDISGSTNLPPGRELTLIIFRGNYDRAILPCEDPWHDPVLRTAVVQTGQSPKNNWSYTMNTSGLISDDYLVYVKETRSGGFHANTLFHLY
jgi:hypothetical protein